MDKTVQDGRGNETITNGASILKQTRVLNPAARMLGATAQENQGSGATSVVVVAGSLSLSDC